MLWSLQLIERVGLFIDFYDFLSRSTGIKKVFGIWKDIYGLAATRGRSIEQAQDRLVEEFL